MDEEREERADSAAGAPVRPLRHRFDGFTAEKRARFFKAFRKSGCVADAARCAGVSRNTVMRWRRKAPGFAEAMEAARGLAAVELEMIAWRRATIGVPERTYRNGELVSEKVRPSDAMLRLLLQGAKPGKYGRTGRGGETKKQIEKRLRKQIDAEMREASPGIEVAIKSVLGKIEAIERHDEPKKLAAGWTKTEDGHWVPPGWVKAG